MVAAGDGLVAVLEAPASASDGALAELVERHNAQEQRPWWRISRLVRLVEPMSVDNGMLTGSMKVSRGTVLARLKRWHEASSLRDFRTRCACRAPSRCAASPPPE